MLNEELGGDPLALRTRPLVVQAPVAEVRHAIGQVTANAHTVGPVRAPLPASGDAYGLQLQNLGLVSIRYSQPVEITSSPTGQRALLVIPRAPMRVISRGATWRSEAPFAMSTVHATKVFPAPGKGALVAALDVAVLEHALETATGRRFAQPLSLSRERGPLLLDAPVLVTMAYREACRILEQPDPDPVMVSLAEQHLMTAVTVGVAGLVEHLLTRPTASAQDYVEVAKKFIEEHLSDVVGVADVAAACNISERQLHAVFSERLSITPAAYIRERRLVRAHELLTDPRAIEGATIGSLIARVGIKHAGRFAKAYEERYGCRPSEDLARTRQRQATGART